MAAGGRGWQCPPHFAQPSQSSLSSGRCLKTWSLLTQQGSLGCAPATERPRRVFSPQGLWGIETLVSCRIQHRLSWLTVRGGRLRLGQLGGLGSGSGFLKRLSSICYQSSCHLRAGVGRQVLIPPWLAHTEGGRRPRSSLSGLSIGLPACRLDVAAASPSERSKERARAHPLFCDAASEATLHPVEPHASQL